MAFTFRITCLNFLVFKSHASSFLGDSPWSKSIHMCSYTNCPHVISCSWMPCCVLLFLEKNFCTRCSTYFGVLLFHITWKEKLWKVSVHHFCSSYWNCSNNNKRWWIIYLVWMFAFIYLQCIIWLVLYICSFSCMFYSLIIHLNSLNSELL